jgi:hypothetical protein
MHPTPFTIRAATARDEPALSRLAMLDSQRALRAPALIAEIAGRPAAAIGLKGKRVVADPFQPSICASAQPRCAGRRPGAPSRVAGSSVRRGESPPHRHKGQSAGRRVRRRTSHADPGRTYRADTRPLIGVLNRAGSSALLGTPRRAGCLVVSAHRICPLARRRIAISSGA